MKWSCVSQELQALLQNGGKIEAELWSYFNGIMWGISSDGETHNLCAKLHGGQKFQEGQEKWSFAMVSYGSEKQWWQLWQQEDDL